MPCVGRFNTYRKSPIYERVRELKKLSFINFSYFEAIFSIGLLINREVRDQHVSKKKKKIN